MAYGIDLEDDRAYCVVRSARRGRKVLYEVLAQADAEQPPEPGRLDKLRAIVEPDLAAGAARAAGHIPIAASVMRWLQTPFGPVGKARKVFPSLLDIQLPFPLESCRYAFLQTRALAGGPVETLAVAAREEHLQKRLEQYRAAGLEPDILDQEGLAAWGQALREHPPADDGLRVVALWRAGSCGIVLGHGRRFLSAHAIPIGARALLPDPAGAAGLRETWGRRLQQILHPHHARIQAQGIQWIWAGAGADRADQRALLEPALAAWQPRVIVADQPASFLARALAERALAADPLAVNFRTGPLQSPRVAESLQRRKQHRSIAALAAGLLLCVLNGAWNWTVGQRDAELQRALTRTAIEISGLSRVPRGQELWVADRARQEQDPLIEPFRNAFRPSLTETLRRLAESAARFGLAYQSLTVRDDFIAVTGFGEDWDLCRAFAEQWTGAGYAVQFDPRDAGHDERVHFTLQARRKP
jgi:hypothetical protein